MNNEPGVSICCIAYKHENYIRECLEGFVMQKTNFPFEVIIHDDASPDKTADIIREYETRYPDIIKPIYQTENQYSKGIKPFWNHIVPRVRGKYIALCEGDDFWTAPDKLQMQYDFMEANPDYSLCMHGRYILDCYSKLLLKEPLFRKFPENGLEFAHRTALGEYLFSTQTMLIRKSSFDSKFDAVYHDSQQAPMGDLQLAFYMGLTGNVKYIPQYMAVYRRASGSVSNGSLAYRLDFEKRANAAVENMLKNAGFPEWIEERSKRKKLMKVYNLFVIPLRILQKIMRMLCLSPKYIRARSEYKVYISRHQQEVLSE